MSYGTDQFLAKQKLERKREGYRRYDQTRPPRPAAQRERKAGYQRRNPCRNLLSQSRYRAKQLGLAFNLTLDDIKIPERCPYLGIVLSIAVGEKGPRYQSPTLDRIDNGKGYVKGNVEVISYRANALKTNLTLEEMLSIGRTLIKRAKARL